MIIEFKCVSDVPGNLERCFRMIWEVPSTWENHFGAMLLQHDMIPYDVFVLLHLFLQEAPAKADTSEGFNIKP